MGQCSKRRNASRCCRAGRGRLVTEGTRLRVSQKIFSAYGLGIRAKNHKCLVRVCTSLPCNLKETFANCAWGERTDLERIIGPIFAFQRMLGRFTR